MTRLPSTPAAEAPSPTPTALRTTRSARWLRRVGLLATAASLLFLAFALRRNADSVPGVGWSLAIVAASVAAVVACAAAMTLSATAWRLLLRGGGFRVSELTAVNVVGRSQIAKYLPGNFLSYVGRVALAREYGIPLRASASTMFLETILIVAVAGTIGAAGHVRELEVLVDVVSTPSLILLAVAAAGLIAVLALAIILPAIRSRLRPFVAFLTVTNLVQAASLYTIGQLLLGGSTWLLLDVIWGAPPDVGPAEVISAATLAWCAGFFTPGAPAGIGVREAVFVALLGPSIGHGVAVGAAFAQRVAATAADLIFFVVASAIYRWHPAPANPPTPAPPG